MNEKEIFVKEQMIQGLMILSEKAPFLKHITRYIERAIEDLRKAQEKEMIKRIISIKYVGIEEDQMKFVSTIDSAYSEVVRPLKSLDIEPIEIDSEPSIQEQNAKNHRAFLNRKFRGRRK